MIYLQLLYIFFMIGAAAFGGGYVTIPMIEHEIVSTRGWITPEEFAQIIAIAQMTPGIIGINAATYTGFQTGGWLGASAATLGFSLPSIILSSIIIWLAARFGKMQWMSALKKSVGPAVAGLVIAAVLTYGKASLTDTTAFIFAVATFVILLVSRGKIHPALLILCGGVVGVFVA